MHFKPIILFAILLTFLASCNSSKKVKSEDTSENQIIQLHDIWSVVEISEYGDLNSIERLPNLEIYVEKKEIRGFGGCNNYSGVINKLEGSEIAFGPIRSTKMACSNLKLESAYLAALQQTTTYRLADLKLTFYNDKNQSVLVFKKVD